MGLHTLQFAGAPLSIETGKVAKQADGAMWIRHGDTIVLVTAMSSSPREGIDFFPLYVDYREMMYASGKIPGSFFRREARPTTNETLTARGIDRQIRPLFPEGYMNEVTVTAKTVSYDGVHEPDVLAMVGASCALGASTIPFTGPVSSVRVGRVGGQWTLNPSTSPSASQTKAKESDLDLLLSGSDGKIVMIEVQASEIPEADLAQAIRFGHDAIRKLNALQREVAAAQRKTKQTFTAPDASRVAKLRAELERRWAGPVRDLVRSQGKSVRREKMNALRKEAFAALQDPKDPSLGKALSAAWDALESHIFRSGVLQDGIRYEGRSLELVRKISCEIGTLPRSHGSALFTRGETQTLAVATLGSSRDEMKVDGIGEDIYEPFYLHYNFPSFSVGETWPERGPKRREIGHGNLAERSIRMVLPSHDEFPYTIRIVSDILESHGSTSMASVCGGTLALMDAGVPIRRPVAGITVGLVTDGKGTYKLLTDITGDEDHHGDMDFKVAGTSQGITGVQLDIKIDGLTQQIIEESLERARVARLDILRIMLEALPKPREALSPLAPRMVRLKVPVDRLGMVIGPGGKHVRGLEAETGAKIDIEDDGTITIFGTDAEGVEKARRQIDGISAVAQVGKVYNGKVVAVKDFGCFVEILPGQDGMLHISQLADKRVEDIHKFVKVGDQFPVRVESIDDSGRVKLSRKTEGSGGEEGKGRERSDRGDRPRSKGANVSG
ncbi:MAG: polyribonucleotide nucleotidyltransferase [Planctomycetes bacterium]|nr:polyribonucleotide nucleotidyltransferase [Planctomycetota bacterium]